MKFNMLLATGAVLSIISIKSAVAQFDADFAVISSAEADLKECPFEPEAEAVILLDKGMSDHEGDLYRLMTFHHTRIKILKKECIDNMDFKIRFRSYDDLESVDNIKAVVINFNNEKKKIITPIDKKQMYRRKVDERYSEISFAFPNLQVGSIIEYSYIFRAKSYSRLRDWSFQSIYPVYKSSYELKMVPHLEMSYAVQKAPEYPIIIKPSKATNSIYFEMSNLPGLPNEPYMASRRDNLQMVFFEVSKVEGIFGTDHWMSTWDEVTRHLFAREDFGSQIKMKVAECDDYVSALLGKTDLEKMNLIYNFVRGKVSWNNEYDLISEKGIRDAWSKKAGGSASINLLLINMLKTAGLKVYPMLVSERGNGKINKVKPMINQFNNVYAAVIVDGKTYYLDATDKYNPSYLVPVSILHTAAFVADHKNGGLREIEAPEERYKDIITVQADFTAGNEIKGSVNIKSFDYSKNIKVKNYTESKSDYAEIFYKKPYGVVVDNFIVADHREDADPFIESFDFKGPVTQTNEYWFLPVNIFSGLRSNPFLEEKRVSEVDFGFKKTVILNYVITLPANKSVSELVKNVQLVNLDKSLVFSRTVSYLENTNQLVSRIKFEQNKGYYAVEEYNDLKEFFKKMINLLEEQCVIREP